MWVPLPTTRQKQRHPPLLNPHQQQQQTKQKQHLQHRLRKQHPLLQQQSLKHLQLFRHPQLQPRRKHSQPSRKQTWQTSFIVVLLVATRNNLTTFPTNTHCVCVWVYDHSASSSVDDAAQQLMFERFNAAVLASPLSSRYAVSAQQPFTKTPPFVLLLTKLYHTVQQCRVCTRGLHCHLR